MAGVSVHPLCALCGKPVEGQIHVDHIIPFHGLDDPLRLNKANLRIMDKRCHMQRTAKDARNSGYWDR